MNNCKNCGAEIPDGELLCSACKASNEPAEEPENAPMPAADAETGNPPEDSAVNPAEEIPETDAEEIPETDAEEIPEADAEETAADAFAKATEQIRKQAKKEHSTLPSQILWAAVLVILAVCVCVVYTVTNGKPKAETVTEEETAAVAEDTETDDDDAAAEAVDAEDGEDTAEESTAELRVFTKADGEYTDADADLVVATCAGEELTNRQLAYYYWYSYSSFINTYYTYVYYYGLLDMETPLYEQACYFDDSISWEEYFIGSAIETFGQFTMLQQEAEAENYAMPEDMQEYLNELESNIQSSAEENGYESSEAYLKACYGAYADIASYREFVEKYYYVVSYDDVIYNSFTFTPEEVEAYFDENSEELGIEKDDHLMVNVRHILITPETVEDILDDDGNIDEEATAAAEEAALAEAEAKAAAIYAEWQTGEMTEDSFAELAMEYSDDSSASEGGLYEEMYPGFTVEAFNDWCFADDRAVGDHGLIQTEYGYHIMYLSSFCEHPYWYVQAEEALLSDTYSAYLSELSDKADIEYLIDNAVLTLPSALYGDTEEEEEEEEEEITAADILGED